MARVQYGTIITQIKGAVGGNIFQKGNNAYVMRNKGYSRGKDASGRQTSTHSLASASSDWRNLTDGQRALWNAQKSNWPFTDKFGNIYYGSGYQYFVAYNTNLATMGLGVVREPTMPAAMIDVTPLSVGVSPDGTILLSIATAGNEFQRMQVYMSAGVSQGRFSTNIPVKLIFDADVFDFEAFDLTEAYEAQFGTIPPGCNVLMKTVQRRTDWPYPTYPTADIIGVST